MAERKRPTQHIQDCFVYLCATDSEFCNKARHEIPTKYMEAVVTQDILQLCYDFYEVYNEAPNDHIGDEVELLISGKNEGQKEKYLKYLKKIAFMDAPNKAYVQKGIEGFVSERQLHEAMVETIKIMNKEDAEAAKTYLLGQLKLKATVNDLGLEYAKTDTPDYYSSKTGAPIISLGLPHIDRRLGMLKAGQLICFFAGYKVGKTWGCLHIARQGLLQGKKVLYISHEASQEELEMRMDMMVGGLTSVREDADGGQTDVMQWAYEALPDGMPDFDHECSPIRINRDMRGSCFDPVQVAIARQNIRKFGGNLRIRKFDMGTAGIEDIDKLLNSLEVLEGWIPDIVINDYVEKMKLPLDSRQLQRDRINEGYIQLKRIADERQVLVVTASQIKTGSLETLEVDESKIPAEDARKLGNVDIGILFQQTKKCMDEGWFLAYVLVSRSSDQKFGCKVSRNLRCGQFAIDTWPYNPPNEAGGENPEYRPLNNLDD